MATILKNKKVVELPGVEPRPCKFSGYLCTVHHNTTTHHLNITYIILIIYKEVKVNMDMAISEVKQGDRVYIVFGFKDGKRDVRIYCGKKGLENTEKNIKKAKEQWRQVKLANLEKQFEDS